MKILIVSQSFYPDNFKINELIKDFADAGHEITVLSGLGDYTTNKIHPNYRFFKNRIEQYNGCQIKRVRTISRRTGPIFRSLNYLSFALFGGLWSLFTRDKFDVVYVYQPSPATMIVPGIVAASKNKIPLLIYCLDIWPEAVKAMKIKEPSFLFNCIKKISRYVYSKANFILVSSKSFMTYLHDVNGISYEKMSYLPQHAEELPETTVLTDIKVENNTFNFVFTGNIGYVQDVETIIQAASLIDLSEKFKIHLVGSGSNFEECQALAKELGVANQVIFYGHQPVKRMPEFYQIADACLLTLKFENKIGLTIPAKLQGYMSAKKPIIAAIEGDGKMIIEEANCGICVPASDATRLAEAMVDFMHTSFEEREKLGENAQRYFSEHFNKKTFVEATLEKMNQLVNGK